MKIHILGPSCSGTTTLGRSLSKNLNIPWFDSDDIFWVKTDPPFTQKREMDERIGLLKDIFEKNDSLVLSGSALKWADCIKDSLDLVIYKYVKQEIRINRLLAREEQRYGDRIKPGNDMYEIHKDFIEWNKKYETGGLEMRSRKSELEWIKDIKCKIIMLEENRSMEEELKIVLEIIKEL